MQKPGIPKGTRDFSPEEMAKRNYIFDTIKSVFKLYGFQQIETPAMENLSTLMGKYGEEGDKLLFKILNSGDFLQTANAEALEQLDCSEPTTDCYRKPFSVQNGHPENKYRWHSGCDPTPPATAQNRLEFSSSPAKKKPV